MKRFIVIFAVCIILPTAIFGQDILVVYTGNSYSSLYPCRVCPRSVGGGVARRATVIEQIKRENKNILLVSAGNLTAGGRLDQESVNAELDEKRTVIYYRTLEAMGYDAAGIGREEFNFGVNFLKSNLTGMGFKFISSNLNLGGVSPYIIKEFDGFKIAVLGLTDEAAVNNNNLFVKEYKETLSDALAMIENSINLIVLLSSFDDTINKEIAMNFPRIKLIISSGNSVTDQPEEIVNKTIILRPSYQAKELRAIDLKIQGGNITKHTLKRYVLPAEFKENQTVKRMIPPCMSSRDCPEKEGMVVGCQSFPGQDNRCVYFEGEKINVRLISDSKCDFCSTEKTEQYLLNLLPGVVFNRIDYRSEEAKKLVDKYQIETLPAFLFPPVIEESASFAALAFHLNKSKDVFLAKRELAGIFLFLNREKSPKRIDTFINLYASDIREKIIALREFCRRYDVKLEVYFVEDKGVKQSPLAVFEREEIERMLAVRELYPDKFWDYFLRRLEDINSGWWIDTMNALEIDHRRVKTLVFSGKMNDIFTKNSRFAEELGVEEGMVLAVNNLRIFRIFKVIPEQLKLILSY
ncbi:MAG: hypothetical protein ABH858_06185 [Candidatus Omnitrophota bacterium]